MKIKHALWGLGGVLIVNAVVLFNFCIYFSSAPHYHQMGWALFCAFQALWILIAGVICLLVSDSHEVAMRQLDLDARRHQREAVDG